MKQDAIRLDVNYRNQVMTIDYDLVDMDVSSFKSTSHTVIKVTTCGANSLPGILVECKLLTDNSGSDPVGKMTLDLSRLGFSAGDTIDYVEINFDNGGGGSSRRSISMRVGFPY
jgi:hypothetical protein